MDCIDEIQVHAIRPAYIVLAGLGAGNILLVIIAIVIICCYPLNRSRSGKNTVSGGGGGGSDRFERHEMSNKNRDYEDGYPNDSYRRSPEPEMPPHQQLETHREPVFVDDNEINDNRISSSTFDDQPPPMRVEENPYFNKSEIDAAAF